jgi:hypothetical protein
MYELGADLFASAFWISLPVVAMLMFANLALGIVSRVAPQMNIYAIGFPITLVGRPDRCRGDLADARAAVLCADAAHAGHLQPLSGQRSDHVVADGVDGQFGVVRQA